MRTPLASSLFAALIVTVLTGASAPAHAEGASPPADCPPGSVGKASGAFSWCEPTVCVIDTDCGAGMLCRTLPLCMNAGSIGGAQKDAGTRLSVTNVCGPNKSCPSDTVCSELPRCVEPAVAQRMNLVAPGASAAPAPSAEPLPAKKSSCGCGVVGARTDSFAAIAGAIGIAAIAARRRTRRGTLSSRGRGTL